MKINLKKILVWCFSIAIVLSIILVVHIYMVTRPKNETEVIRQLSRIDFKQPIDSLEAIKIKQFVAHLDGIESTYFNVPDHILIFTYVVGKQTSDNVYNQLVNYGHYKAERYMVDATTAKKGCPVMDDNSVSYKLTSYVSQLFK